MALPTEKEHKATGRKYARIHSTLKNSHKACNGCNPNDACHSKKLCGPRQAVINNLKMGIRQLNRNFREKDLKNYNDTLKTKLKGALETWHKQNGNKKFKF